MSDCCSLENEEFSQLRGKQRRALVIVLWINGLMFLFEFAAGILANSSALLADSLDMLGDFLTYSLSIYVLARNDTWQAGAALFKGIIQALFAVGVIYEVIDKLLHGGEPSGLLMGGAGTIALIANSLCLLILMKHRDDNLNMQSVWLCSRNDVIGNVGVLVAAVLVYFTGSSLPDIAVGALIAAIFLRTAFFIITSALKQIRAN
ncbi:MAG: cation transporter [Candidatus Nitrohelix vancouverensis]|uniref:Cation transporter n=1 Tax=Candidatus Nitrohelix vancouverensis TaxID=2705534 RepID=A0A7T0G2U3_9BACT|nr:MAG: cation transporter [Candidatus Nitrohelix vancouverensis]